MSDLYLENRYRVNRVQLRKIRRGERLSRSTADYAAELVRALNDKRLCYHRLGFHDRVARLDAQLRDILLALCRLSPGAPQG